MKILGIVGSPRINGNTTKIVKSILDELEEKGASVELIHLSKLNFSGCVGCEGCSKTMKCVKKDDMVDVYNKLEECDGLVLGSPTYFYNVTSLTKSFIDRLYVYNLFSDNDRSAWVSFNEVFGIKYAVSVAVCEQDNYEDMGFTSDAMVKPLTAIGFRCVSNIKALHLFTKNDIFDNLDIFNEGKRAASRLFNTISLSKTLKNS